jgi:hypothetical protein
MTCALLLLYYFPPFTTFSKSILHTTFFSTVLRLQEWAPKVMYDLQVGFAMLLSIDANDHSVTPKTSERHN